MAKKVDKVGQRRAGAQTLGAHIQGSPERLFGPSGREIIQRGKKSIGKALGERGRMQIKRAKAKRKKK